MGPARAGSLPRSSTCPGASREGGGLLRMRRELRAVTVKCRVSWPGLGLWRGSCYLKPKSHKKTSSRCGCSRQVDLVGLEASSTAHGLGSRRAPFPEPARTSTAGETSGRCPAECTARAHGQHAGLLCACASPHLPAQGLLGVVWRRWPLWKAAEGSRAEASCRRRRLLPSSLK